MLSSYQWVFKFLIYHTSDLTTYLIDEEHVAYGKCSKISNTIFIFIFSAVRNFRNYVSEKVLVFVILECGL